MTTFMARNDNCQVVIADVIRNPSDIYTFYGSSHRLVCVSSYNIYSNIEHGQWAPNMSLRFSIWLGQIKPPAGCLHISADRGRLVAKPAVGWFCG